jgi:epoxyqueuosine reductase
LATSETNTGTRGFVMVEPLGLSSLSEKLRSACESRGLIFLGITGLHYPEAYRQFKEWIREQRHAGLSYLEKHSDWREHPEKLLEGAQSALIVAVPYATALETEGPRVAQYARYSDYHKWLKKQAEAVAREVLEGFDFRVLVDSAPVLERALAAQTAKGFIGKNTLFIHPEVGSFLLLGEILTTMECAVDVPSTIDLSRKTKAGGCGPCRLCQQSCPTGALDRAYSIDAQKCLSYWTIEHRGTIPEQFWPWLKEYYFGCDLCQLACPYNKNAKTAPPSWEKRVYPSLAIVAQLDQSQYETYFGGTPLNRAKREGLRRNALIAMAVLRHPELESAIQSVQENDPPVLHDTVHQIRAFLERPVSTSLDTKGEP